MSRLSVRKEELSLLQENPTPAYHPYPTKTGKQRKELDFFSKFRQNKQQHTLPTLVIQESKSSPGTENSKSTRIQRNFHRPTEAKKS
uniref:Uncharacterized protein n=1 Tax=Setaria viridis TaxID=4556 RepID=A0A4V6DAK8_SETVI|nr:hypothetical protein SEVIR_3G423000v2 [Setaria viridis]